MDIGILQRAMDASSLRQKVISDNLANAETPNYKSKQVAFEDVLKQHLSNQTQFEGKRTDSRHLNIGQGDELPTPVTLVNSNAIMLNNGNNVDVDKEMAQMGKNALWYYSLTEQLNSEFQRLSTAITGRSS